MKTRTTKRTLALSFVSMVLCVAMLAGTTFAWFSDSDSTDVNKIVAGELDVVLTNAAGTAEQTEALKFVDANGNTDGLLWEPGVTFKTEGFQVKNDGNLALKYKVFINTQNTVTTGANLLDAIDFSIEDAQGVAIDLASYEGNLIAGAVSGELYLIGHMKEEAGNEYMNATLDGVAITVYATQDTVEFDSYDDLYDEDASLDMTVAADADSLFREAAAGNNVTMSKNIDVTEDIVLADSTVVDGAGYTLTKDAAADVGTNAGILANGGTIKNITITGSGDNAEGKGFRAVYAPKMAADLNVYNATLEGTYALNASGTGVLTVNSSTLNGWTSFDVDSASFTNCKFTAQGNSTDGFELNTFRTYNDVVLTNCDFISPYIFSSNVSGVTVTLEHCTFAGQAITAVNFAELFTITAGDALLSCTVIVDGTPVVF